MQDFSSSSTEDGKSTTGSDVAEEFPIRNESIKQLNLQPSWFQNCLCQEGKHQMFFNTWL
jgi:hypothetical protein